MAYTDEEARKDWKKLDKDALNRWADEFEVNPDDVAFEIENIGANKNDINSHIYGVLCVGGYNYMKSIKDYCENNNINLTGTKLDEDSDIYENDMDILNIYTNYLDSGYDSELSDLVTPNPDDKNILKALAILGIDVLSDEYKLKDISNKEVDIQLAQQKLDTDSSTLSDEECLFFINECEFTVYTNDETTKFRLVDNQGGNLGDIESERFNSLQEVINRLSDSYLVDYGFISRDDEEESALSNLVKNFENQAQDNEFTGNPFDLVYEKIKEEEKTKEDSTNFNILIDLMSEKEIERICEKHDVPESILQSVATYPKDFDYKIYERIAYNENASFETLNLMALSENPTIRVIIAENPRTPNEILENLSKDINTEVKSKAIKRIDANSENDNSDSKKVRRDR